MLKIKTFLKISCASMVAISSSAVWAQGSTEDDAQGGLKEIVVTAQKRSENLQDVPVSVSAMSGETIANAGIQELGQLSDSIPNFSITRDPIGDKINIRGIQSGNNAGLEQSVSTFVDGVYRGRGTQSRFGFLDIDRVEVLRGPQGTLFGKNTIGGALNIATAKPTRDFRAGLSASYTFENMTEYAVDGFVSGPLSDTVRVRLAGQYHNIEEGYIEDLYYGGKAPQMEEYAGRISVEADLTDTTRLSARVEAGNFNVGKQPFVQVTPGPLALFGVPASLDQQLMGSINPDLDIGSAGSIDGKTFEAAVTLDQDIGDHTLTIIGAHSSYDFLRKCDCDFSPLDMIRFDDSEEFKQTTLEVRLASPKGEAFEYIVGGYYLRSSLFADGLAQFNVRGSGSELAIDTLLNAGCQAAVAGGADPATNRSCILSGLITAFDGAPALAYRDMGRYHLLDQDDELFAIFGQATVNITPSLSFTGGVRYAHEKKTAVQSAFPTDFGTSNRNDATFYDNYTGPYAPFAPFRTLAEGVPHTNNLELTENNFTWSAIIAFRPNNDTLLYAKAATGSKAGGFNSFALSADPSEAEYGPESVTGGEIGGKFTIFGGNGEINIAAFYNKFSDIQTALFTGSTSFIVQNAAEASTRGVEIDSRFAIGRNLQIRASLAYVDFRFDSFPNAGCTVDQLLGYRAATGNPLATNQNCAQAHVNDLTGRTSENTPKWSGNVSLDHSLPIGDFVLNNNVSVSFSSSQYRQDDLDPALQISGFATVNWWMSFGPEDGRWSLALLGNNIFDKRFITYGNDTPLIDTARQAMPNAPRTISLRARVKF